MNSVIWFCLLLGGRELFGKSMVNTFGAWDLNVIRSATRFCLLWLVGEVGLYLSSNG